MLTSVPNSGDRALAFWFIMTGVGLILLGACMREIERRGIALPRVLAPGLLLLATLIVIPMPRSGGWLFVPVAWLAHRRARTASSQSQA